MDFKSFLCFQNPSLPGFHFYLCKSWMSIARCMIENPVTIYTRGFTAPIRQCSEGLEYPEEAQIGKREAAPRACSIDTRLLASRGQHQLGVHTAPLIEDIEGVRHQSQGSQLPNSMALGGITFQKVRVPQMTCNRKSQGSQRHPADQD
jgi:hypothetical protein